MIGLLLALGSALGYGCSDFVGGLTSRRVSAWSVAAMGQFTSALVTGVAVLLVHGDPRPVDLIWGAVAGIGNGVGTGFLYRGFGSGRMAVVGPISAVGAVVVPVLAGLATGERPGPLVWAGIAAALPGIWLVSRGEDAPAPTHGETPPGSLGSSVRDGVLAGIGFGVVFTALGFVPRSAGLLPVLVNQCFAVAGVIGLAMLAKEAWRPHGVGPWGGGLAGLLGTTGTLLFLASVQAGSLTISAILTSLYPAVTILLAVCVLRERIHGPQGVGLVLCGAAVALVATG